jgi:hypothetical protein
MRVAVAVCCVAVLTAACQLSGGPAAGPSEAPSGGGSNEPQLGAPDESLPATLEELLARGLPVAEEWQDEPVLSEVEVDVDADGSWIGARLVYLAADADRFLSLVATGAGFSQQRTTLSTLQVQPVTADGLAELPRFPKDALEPTALVDTEVVAECGLVRPVTVLYATGAPVAWDGTAWAQAPSWRATVTDDTAAAVLDMTTGEGECLPD